MSAIVSRTFELSEIQVVVQQLLKACTGINVWIFEGQMGAGKTTLIKAICQQLGVLNTVQSPTFSIVNEYQTHDGETIYHFDCYRLKNLDEAYDIGVEEYLDSGYLCLIEWPDKIASLLPPNHAVVEIAEVENGRRQVALYLTHNNA